MGRGEAESARWPEVSNGEGSGEIEGELKGNGEGGYACGECEADAANAEREKKDDTSVLGRRLIRGVGREGTGGWVWDASLERMPLRSLCLREEERFRGGRGTGYCNMSGCLYGVLWNLWLKRRRLSGPFQTRPAVSLSSPGALIHAPEGVREEEEGGGRPVDVCSGLIVMK